MTALPENAACAGALDIRLSGSNSSQCYADTHYNFPNRPAKPNDIPFICESEACKNLIDIARIVAPVDCVVNGEYYLYRDIVNPIVRQCANVTTANATAAPGQPETPLNANWTTAPTVTRTYRPTSDPFADSKKNIENGGKLVTWILVSALVIAVVGGVVGGLTRAASRSRREVETAVYVRVA